MFYLVDVTGISLVESKLSKTLFLSNQRVYCNELEVIHYAFGQKLVLINIKCSYFKVHKNAAAIHFSMLSRTAFIFS